MGQRNFASAKNGAQLFTLFGLDYLLIVKRSLFDLHAHIPRHLATFSVILGLLSSSLLIGCALEPIKEDPEFARQINFARTSSEHLAIAEVYDRRVMTARARAVAFREQAQGFHLPYASEHGRINMREYYLRIARDYDHVATEQANLSARHRARADNAS